MIILVVFGLINAVNSLFYYLRIPYYLFIKNSADHTAPLLKLPWVENLLSFILVILLLLLFFRPDLLMGWIIRVNFVL